MALDKIRTELIADDAVTAAKIPTGAIGTTEIAEGALSVHALQNTTSHTLSGTYTDSKMYTSDAYVLGGDITVNSNLVLSTVKGDDSDITLTDDGTTRTITGTGKLEGGALIPKREDSVTGMTGELGSVITGSPNLNLTTGTLGRGVAQPIVRFVQRRLDAANVTFADGSKFDLHISDVADDSIVTHSAGTYTIQEAGTYETILNTATQTPNSQWLELYQNGTWMNPRVYTRSTDTAYLSKFVHRVLRCAVGDTIYWKVDNNDYAASWDQTWIQIIRLGA